MVLGCKVVRGEPGPALRRRLEAARKLHQRAPQLPVVMSGGRDWQGVTESYAMQKWWQQHCPGALAPLIENQSQTTAQNARFTAQLCELYRFSTILLVTCDFHLARATRLFRARGFCVHPHAALASRGRAERARLLAREWGAAVLGAFEK